MDDKKSSPVLVPADVTICESLYSTGNRHLPFLERFGLLLTPEPWRFTFSRNGRRDLESVLTKSYGDNDDTITEILKTRQESVRKQVCARTFNFFGTVGLGALTLYSLRYHSIKTKVLVMPFATYAGSLLGRAFGDCYFGRWEEYGRERALGDLPGKRYMTESEIRSYSN
ncbi:hypothetical protein BBOV_II007570 [Babesia bovis T2Bo]|uniref:Uncharacterized protein n=1 Tax=Babesia bovis TaxID=5865 RepID=A7AUU6_BABBO|nr:hypothetical protein BBOV_II007570 [Babesia bovis T2Bo]EDO06707.1 hypothetical protein BBOV_II007570 [Babesia bovis T2Bo]|eukprot:XP_001610275.1 hypothetical protein [Babesia bovis T2Bo]